MIIFEKVEVKHGSKGGEESIEESIAPDQKIT